MDEMINQLADRIRSAAAEATPLCIRGGGSKDFYGGALRGETLSVSRYRGIVDYEPTELVITARAGTPLAEIEDALREHGQMLAFEPPHFDQALPPLIFHSTAPSPLAPLPKGEGNLPRPPGRRTEGDGYLPSPPGRGIEGEGANTATLGGCIAAGLSGPRRAYAGAVRDFVLGVRMLDGSGNDLRFGGQVMKNVAGFDVSRLMAGSLGTLGVILEVSLKVLPLPVAEATLRFAQSVDEAIGTVNSWAGRPLPLSATAWHASVLVVRLSGAAAATEAAARTLGGERMPQDEAQRFWVDIREHTHSFFAATLPLWRLSVKSTAPAIEIEGEQLIEWGGALRWLVTEADAGSVRKAAEAAGGHATLFRGGDKSCGVFHPLSWTMKAVQHNLKKKFDPAGIFNPGRLYEWK